MYFSGSGHSKTEEEHIFARAQQHIAMQVKHMHHYFLFFWLFTICYCSRLFIFFNWQKVALEVGGLNIPGVERMPTNDESPTKVLCLTEVILLSIICKTYQPQLGVELWWIDLLYLFFSFFPSSSSVLILSEFTMLVSNFDLTDPCWCLTSPLLSGFL